MFLICFILLRGSIKRIRILDPFPNVIDRVSLAFPELEHLVSNLSSESPISWIYHWFCSFFIGSKKQNSSCIYFRWWPLINYLFGSSMELGLAQKLKIEIQVEEGSELSIPWRKTETISLCKIDLYIIWKAQKIK